MIDLPPNQPNNGNGKRLKRGFTISWYALALFILLNVIVVGIIIWPSINENYLRSISPQTPSPTEISEPTSTPKSGDTPAPTPYVPPSGDNVTIIQLPENPPASGVFVFSLSEAGYYHLFAYNPEGLPLIRLTYGEWDDIQPALSPDGNQVAYASNKDGQWDIFVLNLISGEMLKVTNDLAYDGAPSWSPDGDQLAYEKYVDNNLEIYIQPIDNSSPAIRVTNNLGADFDPTWNPNGNQIAFTSTLGGDNDIWIVDLEHLGEPDSLINYTNNNTLDQHSPAWSPQGDLLAWIAPFEGYESIYTANPSEEATTAKYVGTGSDIAWDPTGEFILVSIRTPDKSFIASLHLDSKTYSLPPFSLSGRINGTTWGSRQLSGALPPNISASANQTPQAPWEHVLNPSAGDLYGRQQPIPLPDVKAPFPELNALAIEPFLALRDRVSKEAGWDVLSDLENAHVPLTQPMPPSRSNDWLYTGRAFSLYTTLINLDWMKVVREDFGSQTFWRVYLKTRVQDGSQGKPMTQFPWNFTARYNGNTTDFEEGGRVETILPSGYWIDFTALAIEYSWERQPALSNWKNYYQGTRFNLFVITSGLDWEDAMRQLYPPEIFLNPTNP